MWVRYDYYERGTANALSDQSGFKYKRNRMMKEWTGALVGADEFSPKHPQLTLRPRTDRQYTPDPRPENNQGQTLGPIINSSQYI